MLRILSLINTDATPRNVYEILLEEAQATLPAEDGGGTLWDQGRGLLCPALPSSGGKDHCVVDKRLMVSVAANERCVLIENEYQRIMGRNSAGTGRGQGGPGRPAGPQRPAGGLALGQPDQLGAPLPAE